MLTNYIKPPPIERINQTLVITVRITKAGAEFHNKLLELFPKLPKVKIFTSIR